MKKSLKETLHGARQTVVVTVVLMLVCGLFFPLLLSGLSALIFPHQANGSVIEIDGKSYGSELLAQQFNDESHMWGRIMNLDVSTYTRLYLYNPTSGKWQYLNSYKDGVITADTAGRYLLTNQNLRFGNINWSFFIAGGVVVILIAVVYIAFKKRYWFW